VACAAAADADVTGTCGLLRGELADVVRAARLRRVSAAVHLRRSYHRHHRPTHRRSPNPRPSQTGLSDGLRVTGP